MFKFLKPKDKNSSYKNNILQYIFTLIPKEIKVYYEEKNDTLSLVFECGPAYHAFVIELDESYDVLTKNDLENIRHAIVVPALRSIKEQLDKKSVEIKETLSKLNS